jgi:hypothetical protein
MRDGSPPSEAAPRGVSGVSPQSISLRDRLTAAGRAIGEREAVHQDDLAEARRRAEALRTQVADAMDAFHAAAARAGSPHLRIDVGPVHLDDKHVRAVEFAVERGRHVALVIVKARGDVTLVGPFRTGKTEGPCRTFAWGAEAEIEGALGDFLERFLEEAATP